MYTEYTAMYLYYCIYTVREWLFIIQLPFLTEQAITGYLTFDINIIS